MMQKNMSRKSAGIKYHLSAFMYSKIVHEISALLLRIVQPPTSLTIQYVKDTKIISR